MQDSELEKWVREEVEGKWPESDEYELIATSILSTVSNQEEAQVVMDTLLEKIKKLTQDVRYGEAFPGAYDSHHGHPTSRDIYRAAGEPDTSDAVTSSSSREKLYQALCTKMLPAIETTVNVFSHYLQDLSQKKEFTKIFSFEYARYTAFWGRRENDPDRRDSYNQEVPLTIKGIRIYKEGGEGSEPCHYPKDKSLEMYIMEDGDLLECEMNNQMSETPLDPSSQMTTKKYELSRKIKAVHGYPELFIRHLGASHAKDLFLKILEYEEQKTVS